MPPPLETSTTIKHNSAKRNMPKFVHFYNAIMFQMKTQPAKNVKWKDNKEMNSIFRLEFQCINSPSVNQLWSNDPREALQTWTSFILTSISYINLHSQDRSSNYVLSVEHLQEWHVPWQTELCLWMGHFHRLAFGPRSNGDWGEEGWVGVVGGDHSFLTFGLETGQRRLISRGQASKQPSISSHLVSETRLQFWT